MLGSAVIVVGVTAAALVLRGRTEPFRVILVSFLGSYAAVILLSRVGFDADIPWDTRILAPIYIGVLLLVFDLASNGTGAKRWLCSALLGALVLGQLWSWPSLIAQSGTPQGYTSAYWQSVPMGKITARLARYAVVASNRPDVVYFWLHRSALTIPQLISPNTTLPNRQVDVELKSLSTTLDRDGVFVYFVDPANPRAYLSPEGSVVTACGMHLVANFPDVRIYAH